jgi:hypothetical protein
MYNVQFRSYRYVFCSRYVIVQGDQKVSVHLTTAITEYIRNVDRAMLNTVFENTVRRANKYPETGGGHFEYYLELSVS